MLTFCIGIFVVTIVFQGFLCPICHQKFADHNELAQHYTDKHIEEPVAEKETVDDFPQTNQIDTQVENGKVMDTNDEVARWKQQFVVSEESRVLCKNAEIIAGCL